MTKKETKEKRFKDIIQAAVDEFLEKGYEDASMEAIAQRAGLSKGGLYHHFQNKNEIFMNANRKLNEPVSKMMEKTTKMPSPAAGLIWFIKNYLRHWREHDREVVFYSLAMTKMLESSSLWKMYKKFYQDYWIFLESLFERGIESGEFIPHPVKENALMLMSALDGILIHLVINDELDLDEVVSLFEERFIAAYRNKK